MTQSGNTGIDPSNPAPARRDRLRWRLVQWLILKLMSRAARKALRLREIHRADGGRERWLKPEIDTYIGLLKQQAYDIRATARLGRYPTAGSRLMVELTILTLAAYRALLECGAEPGHARQLVADVGWDVYSSSLRLTSLPYRMFSHDPGVRLRGAVRQIRKFPFSGTEPPGYTGGIWREGDDLLTHFTHCPAQSFVRSLVSERGDKGDLEMFYQSWCQYDGPAADMIAADGARGHYVRTKTLSRGDPVCDMCWSARARADGQGAPVVSPVVSPVGSPGGSPDRSPGPGQTGATG